MRPIRESSEYIIIAPLQNLLSKVTAILGDQRRKNQLIGMY